jgi:hypothetical protein
MFFSGGAGGGEEELQDTTAERGFRCLACLQAIVKGVLDPRLPWADTCAVRLRQPVDLVHELKTVKGLLLLVPSRTPRSSGYDVYEHAFYVVMCYMSITCVCLCHLW